MREASKKWPKWLITDKACINCEGLNMVIKIEEEDTKQPFKVIFLYKSDKTCDGFVGFETKEEMEEFYEKVVFSIEACYV